MKKVLMVSLALVLFIVTINCERGARSKKGDDGPVIKTVNQGSTPSKTQSISKNPQIPSEATVKIYFENTLSMDGYINGNTNFKDVLRDLLVSLENEDVIDFTTEFYLINDKLTETDFGVENIKITEKISPKSTAGIGNKGSSDFEEVMDVILGNQKGNVVSIVMADFIYSPKKAGDTPGALNKLKTYTKNAFVKAGRDNSSLDTKIYQFTSDFNGLYYDINNNAISGLRSRPYYYFVMGPSSLIDIFSREIAPILTANPTFGNEALFTNKTLERVPGLVVTSGGNGRIKSKGDDIEILAYPKSGNLEFTVLLNLEGVPVSEEYLLDFQNYTFPNPEFSIQDIGKINGKKIHFEAMGTKNIDPSSLVKMGKDKFTHAFLISATGPVSGDLRFNLRKTIPSWVHELNSNDDQLIQNDSLEQTKTFSLSSLVMGVSEAYSDVGNGDVYFKKRIPLTN